MQLESDGWQYASEMVLKSVHMKLRTAEVPVDAAEDTEGRVPPPQKVGVDVAMEGGLVESRSDADARRGVFHDQAGVGDVDFGPFAYAAIHGLLDRVGGSIDVLDAVWADAFCFGRADGGVGMYHANSSRLSGRCDSAVAARVPV